MQKANGGSRNSMSDRDFRRKQHAFTLKWIKSIFGNFHNAKENDFPFLARFSYSHMEEEPSKSHMKTDSFMVDKEPYITVTEGKATVLFPSSHGVFYNPVQEFNRDISVAVLCLHAEDHLQHRNERKRKKNEQVQMTEDAQEEKATQTIERPEAGRKYENGITILEALSASGLRSIRYAKEVPGVKSIVANDISETAVKSIERNVQHNEVEHLVTTSHNDASLVMYQNRRYADRFHAVDLDPYGCPSMFLDGTVQCVQDGGLLLVTCTDMAVLAGNAAETCYTKYGAVSLKTKACHEMALRIVLQCIESHANRYGRYIVPLLSISADFYVRVFVKVFTSQATCKETTSKLSMVYQCTGCETQTLQPLGQVRHTGKSKKYGLPSGPPVDRLCKHCGHTHHIGGPIWSGPIHDADFVERLVDLVHSNREEFGTAKRMEGMLTVIKEELPNVPLYYTVDRLSNVIHVSSMPMIKFRSAILNAGYRVSISHAHPISVKTDAPPDLIWDILRYWEKENPVKKERLTPGSPAQKILSQEPTNEISFVEHPDANPPSRRMGITRFQENPSPCWGPGTRAMTSVQAEKKQEKKVRNQGKRRRSHSNNASSTEEPKTQVLKADKMCSSR